MGARAEAAEELYAAIIDQELDTDELLERQVARLDVAQGRIRKLARAVYRERVAGNLTKREARAMFVEGFVIALLAEYAYDIPRMKRLIDRHLERQTAAARDLAIPLSKLRPITNVEVKARASARAQRDAAEEEPDPVALAVTGKLKGPGSGRLPDLDNLVDKSPEELVRTLSRFGLEPDVEAFEKRAKRVYEQQLEAAIEEKGFPDRETWKAIDAQLEREAVRTLRQQTKRAIGNYRRERLSETSRHFVWIAVGKGSCPSCLTRHGQVKTMREWERDGAPGSPVLICWEECRCSLQPDLIGEAEADIADAVDEALEGLDEPVSAD